MKTYIQLLPQTAILAILAIPLVASPSRAISTGFEYTRGEYGDDTPSEIWSTNLAFERTVGPLSIGISSSYLRITNPGVSIPGIGPVQEQALSGLATTNPRLASLLRRNATTTLVEEKVSGLGDTWVYGKWVFNEIGKTGLVPSLGAEVKLDTADSEKGLGTGEIDYVLRSSFSKYFDDQGIALDVGYQLLGDPEGLDLRNGFIATFAYWHDVGEQGTLEGSIGWSSKATSGAEDYAMLLTRYSHRFTETFSLSGSLGGGLTDASPDFSLGLNLRWTF